MNKPTFKHAVHGLFVGLLGSLLCLSGTAVAQLVDVEPNDTAADAQLLCIPSSGVTVDAVLGAGSGQTSDLDVFAFDAAQNDPINVGVTTDGTWDSLLVLYDGTGVLLNQNDDYIDAAGNYTTDSRIDAYGLPANGRYFAAVTSVPNYLDDNIIPFDSTMQGMSGGYTLDLSGVMASATTASTGGTASSGSCSTVANDDPVGNDDPPPPPPVVGSGDDDDDVTDTKMITMEVLHWRNQDGDVAKRWKHHLKRKGKRDGIYPIPVVMFSSSDFTATDIDEASLRFGVNGDEESLFRCDRKGKDVNKDGLKDKVCFFDAFKTGFDVGDVQGLLYGEMMGGGEPFASSATLKVFKISKEKKQKKDKHRRHGRKHKHKG